MTDKEILRYWELFQKMEKQFCPPNKVWLIVESHKYNPRRLWRSFKAKRTKFPGLDDV